MNPKTEECIGDVVGICITALILVTVMAFIGYIVNNSVKAHDMEMEEAIVSGRIIKADGYVIEKLTILGHEYLKLGDAMTHSASCPCHKEEADGKR